MRKQIRDGVTYLVIGLLAAFVLGVINPNKALALADTPRWLNIATIEYNNVLYFDNSWDDDFKYYAKGASPGSCVTYLEVDGFDINFSDSDKSGIIHGGPKLADLLTSDMDEAKKVDVYEVTRNVPAENICEYEHGDEITAQDPSNAYIWHYLGTDGQIHPFFNSGGGNEVEFIQTYTKSPTDSNLYQATNRQVCPLHLTQASSFANDLAAFPWKLRYESNDVGGGCDEQGVFGTLVQENPPAEVIPPTSGTDTGSSEPSCEDGGGELSWILCPTLRLASNVISGLDAQINDLLTVPNKYFEPPTGDSLKATWSRLRNIGYIILVPILLIMVIGSALNFEFISAYTIKRALPRLIAAVIFMSLSYAITTFMIVFINDVGSGVLGLLTSSFSPDGVITLASLFDPGVVEGGIFSIAVLAGGVLAAGAILIVLSYALVAAVVLLIVFLALALRQMILIALVLLAPLAILAWIFPGNDKLWKLWWGAFSKLLFLYPLIMILIGGGRVFASIVHQAPGSGFLDTILILTAYIGPYFFIPATFKIAGGLFATITGMANDRSRGFFDRQKKFRQRKGAEAFERAKTGNYFKGGTENNLRGRLSRAIETGTLLPSGGLTTSMSKRRARMGAARQTRNFEHAMKFLEENEAARAIAGDDDKLWAAMNATDEASVRRELLNRAPGRFKESDPVTLNQAVAEVMRFKREAGGVGAGSVAQIAATVAQAGTGTGFNYRDDNIDDDMFSAIIRASGSDRSLQGRMLATMRPKALQSGRVGLAGGGFAKSAQIMDQLRTSMANGGYVEDPNAPGGRRAYGQTEARLELMQDVLQSNAGAAVAGKVEDVKQLAPVMKANVDAALDSGDIDIAAREFAKLAGKHDAAGQIAPQNAEALADGVLAQDIDIASLSPQMKQLLAPALLERNPDGTLSSRVKGTLTYQQAIEGIRNNPEFNQQFMAMRREYGAAGIAAAQATQVAQAMGQQPGGGIPIIPGPQPPGAPPPT